MDKSQELEVAIIGGGLVGSLCACFLGNRGISVKLYELREDIRLQEHVPGRSINLALSERGRSALRCVGLEEEVIGQHGIPMRGRMIHDLDGSRNPLPYGKKGQCIYSVGRRFLNETLLTAAEKNPNVEIFFNHKTVKCDFSKGSFTVQGPNGQTSRKEVDVMVGCDGAYSSVRREMLKLPGFNYSQTYIPHGYLELCIPTTEDGKFAMEANYLHIWPRKTFMLIALPNQDRSYTVTLFMPFEMFSELNTSHKLLAFFNQYFPDAVQLIGRDKLVEDFFKTSASPLVSVKCSPYHVNDNAVILGDAAHAMVPFYGQGMNAGFEDCEILAQLMDSYSYKLDRVLPAFTKQRNVDAEAICDLAMYNYVEMRDLVTSRKFLLRKKIDNLLNTIFPNFWIPLYSMVTFTKIRYSCALSKKRMQDKVLAMGLWSIIIIGVSIILGILSKVY